MNPTTLAAFGRIPVLEICIGVVAILIVGAIFLIRRHYRNSN